MALKTGDPGGPSTYIQPAGLPADLRPVPSAASSPAASGVAPISASAATVGALAFETGTILQHMPDGRSGRSGRAWQESADREAVEQEAADEAYLDAWKGAADAVIDAEWQQSFLRATEGITPVGLPLLISRATCYAAASAETPRRLGPRAEARVSGRT